MGEGLERKTRRRFPIPADPWFGYSEGGQSSRGERTCPPASKAPMRRGGNLIGKAAFAQIEFATDSTLEGDGFELLVPRHKSRGFPQHSGHLGGSVRL